MLVGLPVSAQDVPRDIDSILADQRVKHMATSLTLTADQKAKMRPLVVEEIKAFNTYRRDASLTEEDRARKEQEFRASSKPKFKAILTAEQFGKFERTQQDKRDKKPAK